MDKQELIQGADGKTYPGVLHDNLDGTYSRDMHASVTVGAATIANGANVVEGTTTDAGVITDAAGTIQQFLRGLIKLVVTKAFLVGRISTAVAPADQASVAGWVDVAGSILDTIANMAVSYTIVNDGVGSINWKVLGANAADFSEAVEVQASAAVLAAAVASYSASMAVWRYYKVQIQDTVGGVHGAGLVRGVTKG
jgi:hypothetical protein